MTSKYEFEEQKFAFSVAIDFYKSESRFGIFKLMIENLGLIYRSNIMMIIMMILPQLEAY